MERLLASIKLNHIEINESLNCFNENVRFILDNIDCVDASMFVELDRVEQYIRPATVNIDSVNSHLNLVKCKILEKR